MKQGLIRLFFLSIAIISVVGLFILKTKVIEQEKTLKQIYARISEDSRELQILKSEWADRNDPENLRRLIKAVNLKLVPVTVSKIVQAEKIPAKQIPIPPEKPKEKE